MATTGSPIRKLNELTDELRVEHNRLSQQLLFANQCLNLLDKYRHYLTLFYLNCNCAKNAGNKSIFSSLESEYRDSVLTNDNYIYVKQLNCEPTATTTTTTITTAPVVDNQNITIEVNARHESDSNEDTVDADEIAVKQEVSDSNAEERNELMDVNTNDSFDYYSEDVKNKLNTSKKRRVRHHQKLSDERRKLIVEALNNNESIKTVADKYETKYSTVRTIFKIYQREGRILKKKVGSRPQKLNGEQKSRIVAWINEDCAQNLKQLAKRCADELGIVVSINTISKCLNKFYYSVKLVGLGVDIAGGETIGAQAVAEMRRQYAREFAECSASGDREVFFVDQVEVEICIRSAFGGPRAARSQSSTRAKNFTISAAISQRSIRLFDIESVRYDSENFDLFFGKIFDELSIGEPKVENAVLIIDSQRFHYRDTIAALVESRGHQAVFLPPNAPPLNPMGAIFAAWKEGVRKGDAKNEDRLNALLLSVAETVRASPANNYFENMKNCVNLCLSKQDLTK